jgi:arylsulfatase A-like enzyme
MFEGLKAPRPPSFNEVDMTDKPAWLANRGALSLERIASLDETYRKQAQMLLAVDDMLASLIDTLRAHGELDSTYIVFTRTTA